MKRTVLLVEDDAEEGILLKEIFSKQGWEPLVATNGEIAIEYALESVPTVIVLDLMLPQKGGLHVLKILKSLPETKTIPVLVLTAYPNPEYKEEALACGANGYVVKGELDHLGLVEAVEKILQGDTTLR
jgi:CheY-like chemotaxis protein